MDLFVNVKISILVKQTISFGMNTEYLEITFITVNHISQQIICQQIDRTKKDNVIICVIKRITLIMFY